MPKTARGRKVRQGGKARTRRRTGPGGTLPKETNWQQAIRRRLGNVPWDRLRERLES